MAESLSHKFGQIIGELIEKSITPMLKEFAEENGLYIDMDGTKRKARPGKKVTWIDDKNNRHDLDFVLERGGTDEVMGVPVAFIESAWRRYTKHSKNKVQEIANAILPLRDRYKHAAPFIGVILAGEFTEGALEQLRSQGFGILHFPYPTVVEAFKTVNMDVSFDEKTPEIEFKRRIKDWNEVGDKDAVCKELFRINHHGVEEFLSMLKKSVSRQICSITIFPLYGKANTIPSIVEAIHFLEKYEEYDRMQPIAKYEVVIKYNNGDKIEASFQLKKDCISFLEIYN
jgi:hypothetical protein